jgi:hypothetical protein
MQISVRRIDKAAMLELTGSIDLSSSPKSGRFSSTNCVKAALHGSSSIWRK